MFYINLIAGLITLIGSLVYLPEHYESTNRKPLNGFLRIAIPFLLFFFILSLTFVPYGFIASILLAIGALGIGIEVHKSRQTQKTATANSHKPESESNKQKKQLQGVKETIESHLKTIKKQSDRIKQYQPPYEHNNYYTDLNDLLYKIKSVLQSETSKDYPKVLDNLLVECAEFINRQSNIIKELDKKHIQPQPRIDKKAYKRKQEAKRNYTYRTDRPQKGSVVTFTYTNLQDETRQRHVQITSVRGGYLYGIDLDADDRRTFNVERIHKGEVTDCDTGQIFDLWE